MTRQYNPTAAGRQIYVASNGVELERKYLYAHSHEWEDMLSLAKTVGLPLGKMLVSLAYAEIRRIRADR